jgi:hypothetical protein
MYISVLRPSPSGKVFTFVVFNYIRRNQNYQIIKLPHKLVIINDYKERSRTKFSVGFNNYG